MFLCLSFILWCTTFGDATVFFHEPSYISFSPSRKKDDNTASYFGFSMAYDSKSNSLVVGAPRSDLDGKIYRCLIEKKSCSEIDININKIMKSDNFSRDKSPNQQFWLGASVAVIDNNVITCAPLITNKFQSKKIGEHFGAFGTCFINNGMKTLELNFNKTDEILETFYGGIGWNILDDTTNDVIIISKPTLKSSIHWTSRHNPLAPVETISFHNLNSNLDYAHIGRSMTTGIFFEDGKNSKHVNYAISMEESKHVGVIAFLKYDPVTKFEVVNSLDGENVMLLFRHESPKTQYPGSSFGSFILGVDVTNDGYSELIVGAPTQFDNNKKIETGAIHIYRGGYKRISRLMSNLCIIGNSKESYFGSSIAAIDLDEDHFPEIIVSAFNEDGSGAVHIISGFEIKNLLKNLNSQEILLTQISERQTISNKKFNMFGYGLQPVLRNGRESNYLAVGSPASDTVALYRGIPFITVVVSAHLAGGKVVREQDVSFTVCVSIDIKYPSNIQISGELSLTVHVFGNGSSIPEGSTHKIPILSSVPSYEKNILVNLDVNEPGNQYKFEASVKNDQNVLAVKEFDNSLVSISRSSVTKISIDVFKKCKKDDCTPELKAQFLWSQTNETHYVLGSSTLETLIIKVQNYGSDAYGSCANIRITGAKVKSLPCKMSDSWYRCVIDTILYNKTTSVEIKLDMTKNKNTDKSLQVELQLLNSCIFNKVTTYEKKTIDYLVSSNIIDFDGESLIREVTDRELENDTSSSLLGLIQTYTIFNDRSLKWEKVEADIIINDKKPYIINITIDNDAVSCIENLNSDKKLVYKCIFGLDPISTLKIPLTINLDKKTLRENKSTNSNQLLVKCEVVLHLLPSSDIKTKHLVSTIIFKTDRSFGSNKELVMIISIVVAIIVIGLVHFIFYKTGLYKSNAKIQLEALKEERRKQSIAFRPEVFTSILDSRDQQPDEQGEEAFEEIQMEEYAENSRNSKTSISESREILIH